MNKNRLIVSEDEQSAVLDGDIKLITKNATCFCEGCFLFEEIMDKEDIHCSELTENGDTVCCHQLRTDEREIIWVKEE